MDDKDQAIQLLDSTASLVETGDFTLADLNEVLLFTERVAYFARRHKEQIEKQYEKG